VMKFRIFFESYLKFASVVFEKLNFSLLRLHFSLWKGWNSVSRKLHWRFSNNFQKRFQTSSQCIFCNKKGRYLAVIICPLRRLFWLI
jgi:hypothetical protein